MKKLIKWFSIFAVVGTAVGLAVAYFCKKDSDNCENSGADFTEDEDFDLDADLQPAGREYVSLKKETEENAETSAVPEKEPAVSGESAKEE